jgi:hypothetical protein
VPSEAVAVAVAVEVVAAAGAAAAVPGSAVVLVAGGGAISDWPQVGHTTQAGSSMILRQFWQRFGANGSTWPQ